MWSSEQNLNSNFRHVQPYQNRKFRQPIRGICSPAEEGEKRRCFFHRQEKRGLRENRAGCGWEVCIHELRCLPWQREPASLEHHWALRATQRDSIYTVAQSLLLLFFALTWYSSEDFLSGWTAKSCMELHIRKVLNQSCILRGLLVVQLYK